MSESPTVAEVPEAIAPKRPVALSPSAHQSRIDKMREYFKQRPKEKIRIRPADGEQWVQINSYAFRIQAGKEVSVPVDVAEILRGAGVI